MITGKLEPYPIFRKSAGLVEDPVTRGSTSADPVMIASGMEGSISVVPPRGVYRLMFAVRFVSFSDHCYLAGQA